VPFAEKALTPISGGISVRSIQVGEGRRSGSVGSVSIATSLASQGFITLTGTALSAGSIGLPAPGNLASKGSSSSARPAFSNIRTVDVNTGMLRLADNPVQLHNGTLSGGSWLVSGAATNMSDGSPSATSVAVRSGSTLQGNRTVEGSVTDNGNAEPQGSLTVMGNYAQASSAALTDQRGDQPGRAGGAGGGPGDAGGDRIESRSPGRPIDTHRYDFRFTG
jgi:hypothetical protein